MVNEATEHYEVLGVSNVTELLHSFENSVPDLSGRMTVRMLRMLVESGAAEMKGAGEEDVCRRAVAVFQEMKKTVQALTEASAGSAVGRLCAAVAKGMGGVVIADMWQCSNEGNTEGVIQEFLTMYASVGVELVALAQDESFVASMGPGSRCALMGLEAIFQDAITSGHRVIEELSAGRYAV